jgi:hypothetical protein
MEGAMSFRFSLLLVLIICFASAAGNAQNPPAMGATVGLGPGDTFSLFVTFQEPMPGVTSIGCQLTLVGAPKSGQERFNTALNCNGSFTKDDETHYRAQVPVTHGTSEGDYKLNFVDVNIGSAFRRYQGNDLPNLASVSITNHEHLKFSDIKKLDVQK